MEDTNSNLSDSDNYNNHLSTRISKSRNAASQCFAALAANIVKFAYGNFIGMTTLIVGDLKHGNDIAATKDEITWFGSYVFMGPVGAIVIGLLAQRIGSRRTLWITSFLFSLSWLLFYRAHDIGTLLACQALMGIIGSTVLGPGITFIVEITQPHLRGALMACSSLSLILGTFYAVSVGTMVHWRQVCLASLPFPIIGFVAMTCVPETPHWLAARGRFDEAGKSLAWLRGWTRVEQVRPELEQLRASHGRRPEPPEEAGSSGLDRLLAPYLRRSFCVPLCLVCYIFVVHAFAGSRVLQTYALVIFKEVRAPLDEHLATVVFDAVRITGAITCISCVHFVGKRRLVFFSLLGAGLAYSGVAGLLLTAAPADGPAPGLRGWLPTLLIIFASYATSSGIDKVASMLNAELFPSSSRNFGNGLGMFFNALMSALTGKTFLYLLDDLTMPGVFLMFASASFLGLATFYYLIPETEGRTLAEIEQHYAGVKDLDVCPAKGKTDKWSEMRISRAS